MSFHYFFLLSCMVSIVLQNASFLLPAHLMTTCPGQKASSIVKAVQSTAIEKETKNFLISPFASVSRKDTEGICKV